MVRALEKIDLIFGNRGLRIAGGFGLFNLRRGCEEGLANCDDEPLYDFEGNGFSFCCVRAIAGFLLRRKGGEVIGHW